MREGCWRKRVWMEDLLMRCAGSSLNAPTEVVKQIIVNIESGVEVEVTIAA